MATSLANLSLVNEAAFTKWASKLARRVLVNSEAEFCAALGRFRPNKLHPIRDCEELFLRTYTL